MKAKQESAIRRSPSGTVGTVHPIGLGILASLLLTGCSTEQSARLTLTSNSGSAPVELARGAIAISCAAAPARFSFDAPQGRIESAGDGATDAARSIMNTPRFVQRVSPDLHEALGALEFAAAPFAATYGALRAAHRELSSGQLEQTEADLVQAMQAAAKQQELAQLVAESARDQDRWRVIPQGAQPGPDSSPPSALLETQVRNLKLVRLSNSDSSFVLRIKVRARLLRPSDRQVLSERAYQWQSGKAMFIDWASWDGLRSVATTAYHSLAHQIAIDLLPPASDQPLLLGAGYQQNITPVAGFTCVGAARADSRVRVQPVNLLARDNASLELYPRLPSPDVFIQRPLTRQEAVEEAVQQDGWDLDSLQDDRNSVVQAAAQVAIVPVGLWRQVLAMFEGRSERSLQKDEAALQSAAFAHKPSLILAQQVAFCLAAQSAEKVCLVEQPSPLGPSAITQPVLYPTPEPTHASVQRTSLRLPAAPPEAALEIEVLNAELTGKTGINPPLALRIEAKATLRRLADGHKLYSCPVFYRSQERRFKKWAAADAQLFRRDLDRGYAEMGNALARRLLARKLAVPASQPEPTLAGK